MFRSAAIPNTARNTGTSIKLLEVSMSTATITSTAMARISTISLSRRFEESSMVSE